MMLKNTRGKGQGGDALAPHAYFINNDKNLIPLTTYDPHLCEHAIQEVRRITIFFILFNFFWDL